MYTEPSVNDDTAPYGERQHKALRGAILVIDRQMFERILNLPADVNVVAVYDDPMRAGLVLHLVGDSLPEIREDRPPAGARIDIQSRCDAVGAEWWRRCTFRVVE